MGYITNEQIEDFLSTLEKKYHRDDFYNLFLDYAHDHGIEFEDDDEEGVAEQTAFSLAKERGFIGYDIIQTIENMEIFQEKMNSLVKRNGYVLYHLFHEIDNDISTTAFWDKWSQVPPLGWFGGWCNCGKFFPYTFDICEMNMEEDEYSRILEENRPLTIWLDDIETVLICSDSFFRLKLNDGKIIAIRPYKYESGFSFNFLDNPLDILK